MMTLCKFADTTYVTSSARDHYRQQTVAGGFMVERAPEYANMFSKLPQYPSTTFRSVFRPASICIFTLTGPVRSKSLCKAHMLFFFVHAHVQEHQTAWRKRIFACPASTCLSGCKMKKAAAVSCVQQLPHT